MTDQGPVQQEDVGKEKVADANPAPTPSGEEIMNSSPSWGNNVFVAGLAVGLLLVAVGFGAHFLAIGRTEPAKMILSAGLGIVLGAFGAMAVVRYKGVVLAGVAGTTMVIFWALAGGGGGGGARPLTIVLKPVPSGVIPSLFIGHAIPGTQSGKDRFEFLVVAEEVAESTIELDLTQADKTEVPFHCIPADTIRGLLGTGQTIEWFLNPSMNAVWVAPGKKYEANCGSSTYQISRSDSFSAFSIVGAALAQDAAPTQVSAQDIQALLNNLEIDDAALRHDARKQLAGLGTVAIPQMMSFWHEDPTDYRRTLGVSVALTEFLRDNKNRATEVSQLLSPSDYDLLVAASGNADRTVRVYATEFLFDLGSPGAVESIVNAFPTASQNGQYNSVFVLNNVVPNLTAPQKMQLVTDFQQIKAEVPLGTQTQQAIQALVTKLNSEVGAASP